MKFLGSLNSAAKTRLLKITYLVTIALLLSLVALTPIIIRYHFLLFKKYIIQEDVVEAALIIFLLLIAYFLSAAFKNELNKYRKESYRLSRDNIDLSSRLTKAFKYIGGVNVQLQEIRSVFCELRKYPETARAFKDALALLARKVLGMVNAEWVMIRIICQPNLRTIKEHLEARQPLNFVSKGISNKAIVANQTIDGFSIVASHHDNSMIVVACVLPKESLVEEEKILVEVITYQIEMLYFIFDSCQPHEAYPTNT